jgi:hypothetical protein
MNNSNEIKLSKLPVSGKHKDTQQKRYFKRSSTFLKKLLEPKSVVILELK